jgi:hypothetical protein
MKLSTTFLDTLLKTSRTTLPKPFTAILTNSEVREREPCAPERSEAVHLRAIA